MSNQKVSVIVPAYNSEKYIEQALDSVQRQTYSNWECIIVDDGSTDNTAEIVKGFCMRDSRFKYYLQQNNGPAAARNTAVRYSSGEYLLPVDSDDLIAQTYMEKAIERFTSYPETTLVYGLIEKFEGETGLYELQDYSYEKLLLDGNMIMATSMYRRSDFDKVGGYRLNLKGGLEDWDFWIALLTPESVVYKIPEVMLYYRIRENSRTTHVNEKAFELRTIIYWNNAQKYERYLPNMSFYRYYGRDCDKIINELPDNTREHIKFFQRHIFLSAGEYSWKHAIINKIAQALGIGFVFNKKEWYSK